MAKGTFHPIKRELLASQPNPAIVRKVIRILSMSARERVRAFEENKFHKSVWVFFGHIGRKYAASKNLRQKMMRTDASFFCIDY